MPDISLLDLVALNNGDSVIGLVESAVYSYPELGILDAVPHPGTGFDVCRRTAIPNVAFSNSGQGSVPTKSTYVLEHKPMFLMEPQLQVPMSIIAAQKKSVGDILTLEADGVMNSAFFHLCQQFYYGNSRSVSYGGSGYASDALGFPGYCDMIFGDTNFEISAGGASGASTSVYLVCCHEKGASLAVGNEGSMNILPWVQQQIALSNGNVTQAMVSAFMGWFGLTLANEWTVWRVKGIDATHPLTDALIAQVLALVPVQYRINMHLFLNRFASYSLQKSRTSVTQQPAGADGAVGWSPEPEFSNKIPITVTEAITNTELV
jgi:hypothetical protein